jgi:hypothetical protein
MMSKKVDNKLKFLIMSGLYSIWMNFWDLSHKYTKLENIISDLVTDSFSRINFNNARNNPKLMQLRHECSTFWQLNDPQLWSSFVKERYNLALHTDLVLSDPTWAQ